MTINQTDESNYLERTMRTKWRCSQCGRLNSVDHDNYCPKCMGDALEEDQKKVDQCERN